jgi:hypothetical protein
LISAKTKKQFVGRAADNAAALRQKYLSVKEKVQ